MWRPHSLGSGAYVTLQDKHAPYNGLIVDAQRRTRSVHHPLTQSRAVIYVMKVLSIFSVITPIIKHTELIIQDDLI